MDKKDIEALRLQLLANGYTPIRNRDKRTFMKGWPGVEITQEEVVSWTRKFSRDKATGLRVQDKLLVIDLDVTVQEIVDAIADCILEICPQLDREDVPLLVRTSGAAKEAWFLRVDEPFGRIHSRTWREPDGDPDGPCNAIEIFGGASPRQFGAFGGHTVEDDGTVVRSYEWRDQSPLDVKLADLPTITKAQCFKIVDAAEDIMREHGLEPVKMSQKGENDAIRVYDLGEGMAFDCDDGNSRSLGELREHLASGVEGLRCSASWIEGPQAKRTDRCLCALAKSGHVSIHETASGVTHIEAAADPVDPNMDLDLDRLAELLQEAADRRRNKLSAGDDFNTALMKSLSSYAFCPPTGLVVPLWPVSVNEGETFSSFRIRLAKHGFNEPGATPGKLGKFHNPCDSWMKHDQLTIVDGMQMRPDKPRPTFKEEGRTYVNTYRPVVFKKSETEGGDASVGLDFIRRLIPDDDEHRCVLQWVAFKVRYPHVPSFAMVMVAHQQFGTGRNTFGDLMGLLLGETYVREVPFEAFTGKTYQSQYNDWLVDTLMVVVSESAESADGSTWTTKKNTYERLKQIVDPRPGRPVLVNVKGRQNYYARTCASFLIATNHADALPIPENDRRFCVVRNGDAQPQSYWRELRLWMSRRENIAAFLAELNEVDIAGYSPFDPPLFEGKSIMADESKSDLDQAFEIAVANLQGELVTPPQMTAIVRSTLEAYNLDRPNGSLDVVVKRIMRKSMHRVGVRHGFNWFVKVDGDRFPIYATSSRAAKKYSDPDNLHDNAQNEVMRNGDPRGSGKVVVAPFNKRERKEDGDS